MPVSQETFERVWSFVKQFYRRTFGLTILFGLIYGSYNAQPNEKGWMPSYRLTTALVVAVANQ
jgi:hypothetical protein